MGDEETPTVVLAFFDQSQSSDVATFKGAIQETAEVEVLDFDDIHHEYRNSKKINTYPKKLRAVLDRAKLAILITPGDASAIQDNKKLLELITSTHKDVNQESAKIFGEFVKLERDRPADTKLVFCSFGGGADLPDAYSNVEHVKDMMKGSEPDRKELKRILTKVKKPARDTFPEGGKKGKDGKECLLM